MIRVDAADTPDGEWTEVFDFDETDVAAADAMVTALREQGMSVRSVLTARPGAA